MFTLLDGSDGFVDETKEIPQTHEGGDARLLPVWFNLAVFMLTMIYNTFD